MTSAAQELKKGAGAASLISGYRVAETFEIPILNRDWNPDDPESLPAFALRCRRWRVGEKDAIREAAENMVSRLTEIGSAALTDPLGQFFEGGVPTRDEAWNFCLFQALIVGFVIQPAKDGRSEIVDNAPDDLQLAEMVGQCPELCATIVAGLDANLKTQLSSAELLNAKLQKKILRKTPHSTGAGEPAKPSTTSPRGTSRKKST